MPLGMTWNMEGLREMPGDSEEVNSELSKACTMHASVQSEQRCPVYVSADLQVHGLGKRERGALWGKSEWVTGWVFNSTNS